MTTRKAIDRLLLFAPAIIAASTKVPHRCIYATALTIDTLARFEIAAVPVAVDVVAWNRAAWILDCQGNRDPFDWRTSGAFVLSTLRGEVLVTMPYRHWIGHLVAHVPGVSCLIDADLGALSRPHRDLVLPEAGAFDWPSGTTLRRYDTHGGGRFEYRIRVDEEWRESPDWTNRERIVPMVDRLAKAIRKDRL